MSSQFFTNMIRADALRTGCRRVSFNDAPLVSPQPVRASWVTDSEATNSHANKLANLVESYEFEGHASLPTIVQWDNTYPSQSEQYLRCHERFVHAERVGNKAVGMFCQMFSDECYPPITIFVYCGDSEDFICINHFDKSESCDWSYAAGGNYDEVNSQAPDERLETWIQTVNSSCGLDPLPREEYTHLPKAQYQSTQSSKYQFPPSGMSFQMANGPGDIKHSDASLTPQCDQADVEQLEDIQLISSPSLFQDEVQSPDVSSLDQEEILVWTRSEDEVRLERGRRAVEHLDRLHERRSPYATIHAKYPEEGLPAPLLAYAPPPAFPSLSGYNSSSPWSDSLFSPKEDNISDSSSECSFA